MLNLSNSMALKLYNTLTRKKENFKPLRSGEVGIYSCGPTVYWFQHIGNIRSYIFADILKRILRYNGYKVKHVINITDVGHLTGDSDDTGSDKMENAAKREGKTVHEITDFYFKQFHIDLKKVNIIDPDYWPKATEHISEQIELIKKLEKKGYTYKTDDGIYFDTSKFKSYGKLSKKNADALIAGQRTEMRDKHNKTDFALWKFSNPQEKRLQEWASPWGKGFPGWHIECSAMSTKYLGKKFDIHTGGIDHIPIHHENEIAQTEAALGLKKWVNYWMHGAFLTLDGGKMSKSKGEIKTISELESQDFIPPLAYRYFTFTAHYRKPLSWNSDAINSAVNSYKRLKELAKRLNDSDEEVNKKYLKEFENKINDDLDMPGAIAVMWEMLRDESAKGKVATIKEMDKIFGLDILEKEEIEIPKEIKELAESRLIARKKKDWKKSDELRHKIKELGWSIKDTETGYILGNQ